MAGPSSKLKLSNILLLSLSHPCLLKSAPIPDLGLAVDASCAAINAKNAFSILSIHFCFVADFF